MLIALHTVLALHFPPGCTAVTRAEAAAVLGEAVIEEQAIPPERAPEMRGTITMCTFRSTSRSLIVVVMRFDSPAAAAQLSARAAQEDREAEERAREERASAAAALAEMSGDERKSALRQDPDEMPSRIRERDQVAGVDARFRAEPERGNAAYSGLKGRAGVELQLMWSGKPSDVKTLRPALRTAFAAAVSRL